MQKATGNHCIHFSKHQAMKDNHKNRKQGDGIRNPESGRGDRAWLPRSSASEIHAGAKNKTLKIKSKTKLFQL